MLFVGGSCGYTFSLNKKIHFGFQCSTRCIEKQGTYSFCQRGISNISTERRIWLKFPLPKRIHSGFQCIARFIDKWTTDFLCQRWISITSRERRIRLKFPWNKIVHAVFRCCWTCCYALRSPVPNFNFLLPECSVLQGCCDNTPTLQVFNLFTFRCPLPCMLWQRHIGGC